MTFVILFCALAALLLAYAFIARPWLRAQPALAAWWAWLDPIEVAIWQKSRTLLVSRLYWLGGLLVGAHDAIAVMLGGQDWTPFLQRALAILPPDLLPLAIAGFVALTGIVFEWLRHATDRSVAATAAAKD